MLGLHLRAELTACCKASCRFPCPWLFFLSLFFYYAPAGSLRDRAFYPLLTPYGWQHGKTLGRPLSEAAVV